MNGRFPEVEHRDSLSGTDLARRPVTETVPTTAAGYGCAVMVVTTRGVVSGWFAALCTPNQTQTPIPAAIG
jgi:hypothetical protein